MAYKIKASRYVEICKKTMQRKTRYRNSAPWNCGYYDGTYLYGDCWCFNPKVILWSESIGQPVYDNYTVGKYYYANGIAASGMPDATGDYIMANFCTSVSFAEMLKKAVAPCLLLITNQHMGAYIGEWTENGKTYNVCEYTSNSNLGNGLCKSYCDENGARRVCKDGKIIGYWNKAGYLTSFVDYSDAPASAKSSSPLPTKAPKKSEDEVVQEIIDGVGGWGNGAARKTNLAKAGYNAVSVQAKVELMLATDKDAVHTSIAKAMPVVSKGKSGEAVKILQTVLKDAGFYTGPIDGEAGSNTDKAIRAIQTKWAAKDKNIVVDGSFGPKSWKKLQEV